MPVLSSQWHLFEKPLPYTQHGMVSIFSSGHSVGDFLDDCGIDNTLEITEIHHHPIIGLPDSLFDGATQRYLQPIGVPMWTLAFALVA